jgi:hypothetical protein
LVQAVFLEIVLASKLSVELTDIWSEKRDEYLAVGVLVAQGISTALRQVTLKGNGSLRSPVSIHWQSAGK